MNGVNSESRRRVALWRHYEAALDRAALITALCRCKTTDREPLDALRGRQRLQLADLLYEFCYYTRRALELAEQYEPGILEHAMQVKLPGFGERTLELEIGEDAVELVDESLWWVLNRVIHSRQLSIHDAEDAEVGTKWSPAPNITMYYTPAAFGVRSDRDEPDKLHWVRIERLIEAFLALRSRFARALNAVGIATDEYALEL
jgi:hypothetical protein